MIRCFSKSTAWLFASSLGTNNSCTVKKSFYEVCLLRGIKDRKVKMPSDSTLLTALERLMSLYEARPAEAFFHFLWGICNDVISFLLLHILIPTCLNCLLNLKHCCVEVLLLSTVFCSLQMCSEVIKFHNQPAHSSVFISSN